MSIKYILSLIMSGLIMLFYFVLQSSLVFNYISYNSNPYRIHQEVVKPEAGKFAMFDSTLPHFVTKNQSDELRVVISMNFKYKD